MTADVLPPVICAITAVLHPGDRWRVGPQASLKHDLGIDQLDRLTIACAIDEALLIEIPDLDLAAWETIADVVTCAARLAGSKPRRVAQPNYAALGLGSAEEAEGRN